MTSEKRVVILNDTAKLEHHGCRLVSDMLAAEFVINGIRVNRIPIGRMWRQHIKVVNSASVVIINGEGTFHHSSRYAADLLQIVPHCNRLKIPVILLNSTWQDNSERMISLARGLDRIFVRESFSRNDLEKNGIASQVVPDLSLRLAKFRTLQPRGSKGSRLYLGSADLETDEIIATIATRDPNGELTSIATPRKRYTPIPELGSPNLLNWPNLRTLDKRDPILHALMSAVLSIPEITSERSSKSRKTEKTLEKLSLDALMEKLNGAEMVLSGRFHGICISMLSSTPFWGSKSNSHKIEGMLHDADLSHRIISELTEDVRIQSMMPWGDSESSKVIVYIKWAIERQDEMFSEIIGMI